jgi:hypothetical protein
MECECVRTMVIYISIVEMSGRRRFYSIIISSAEAAGGPPAAIRCRTSLKGVLTDSSQSGNPPTIQKDPAAAAPPPGQHVPPRATRAKAAPSYSAGLCQARSQPLSRRAAGHLDGPPHGRTQA